jgi:hypothetical protein
VFRPGTTGRLVHGVRADRDADVRYVSIERMPDGFAIDPSAYVDQLSQLGELLPSGARAFARETGHYDFNSLRFIKNLKPQRLISGVADGRRWLELELRHNCWRHEEDLTVRYSGVRGLELNGETDNLDVSRLGEVLLDEVLPHSQGCSHEVACLGGSLLVVCEDLTATWFEADCSERFPQS